MKKIIVNIFVLLTVLVWIGTFQSLQSKNMGLITCDVGQGDANLITKGKYQILIDGGPGNKVLDCLSKYMPFWDRKVELVILTHPQNDHYEGLISVFENYEVDTFIGNSLDSGSSSYQVLKNRVGGSQARVIKARSGQKYRLGMIYLDILYPTEEFLASNEKLGTNTEKVLGSTTTKRDSNEFSVVVLASLGEFSALYTGDAGPSLSDEIAEILSVVMGSDPSNSGVGPSMNGKQIHSIDYIKIPHHGSKNGISTKLLDVVSPEALAPSESRGVAVISVGKNNSYGHPHKEVTELLSDRGIKILRTDEMGDIVVYTDGLDIRVRP